jgi:hypothetical protein
LKNRFGSVVAVVKKRAAGALLVYQTKNRVGDVDVKAVKVRVFSNQPGQYKGLNLAVTKCGLRSENAGVMVGRI